MIAVQIQFLFISGFEINSKNKRWIFELSCFVTCVLTCPEDAPSASKHFYDLVNH